MGSGENKGRGEGPRGDLRSFSPYSPPPIQCFFLAQIFFALPPLTDRLEKATKYVFKSAW